MPDKLMARNSRKLALLARRQALSSSLLLLQWSIVFFHFGFSANKTNFIVDF